MKVTFLTEVLDSATGLIKVSADLDSLESAQALTQAFIALQEKNLQSYIVDLSGVQQINSHGIGKIIMLYKKLKAEGKKLVLRGPNSYIRETLTLLMLDRLLEIET